MSSDLASVKTIVVNNLELFDDADWATAEVDIANLGFEVEPLKVLHHLSKRSSGAGANHRPLITPFQIQRILNPRDRGGSLVISHDPTHILLDRPDGWKGAGGTVFKAIRRVQGQAEMVVALKEIKVRPGDDLKRVQRELDLLGSKRSGAGSENVVNGIDRFQVGESLWLVMELCKGRNFEELVESYSNGGKRISVRQALYLVHETLAGLHFLHRNGIIHRDIKPKNIIYRDTNQKPRVVIVDLGIAKVVDDTITLDDSIGGTPHYMAPECYGSAEKANEKSDVYSAACVLYYLLTGEPPSYSLFLKRLAMNSKEFKNEINVFKSNTSSLSLVPLDEVRENLPVQLGEIVNNCLNKEPSERLGSAKEFRKAIHSIIVALDEGKRIKKLWPGLRRGIQKIFEEVMRDGLNNIPAERNASQIRLSLNMQLAKLAVKKLPNAIIGAKKFNMLVDQFIDDMSSAINLMETVVFEADADEKHQILQQTILEMRQLLPQLFVLQHLLFDSLDGVV